MGGAGRPIAPPLEVDFEAEAHRFPALVAQPGHALRPAGEEEGLGGLPGLHRLG